MPELKNRLFLMLPRPMRDRVFWALLRRPNNSARRFDYDRNLLPNEYLAQLESRTGDLKEAVQTTGMSLGYPAWNLLYYSLLCSIPERDPVVVETGTNRGFSSIVMAQALKDSGHPGIVRTVEFDPSLAEVARQNID